MTFFDANVIIGRWPAEKLAYDNADGLISGMCCMGIEKALVSHTIAWKNSPILGNDILMKAISHHPELEPCWVISPGLQVDEQGGVLALCERMAQCGVRAVRFLPRDHVYSLNSKTSVELLNELNRRHYLIIIDLDQIFTQSGLYDYSASSLEILESLCVYYPNLSILLTKVGYRAFQIIFSLMQKYPNLFLDLSFFATHQGVETVVKKLGAERLLFGSGQPLLDAGGALFRLTAADISDEDRQKIAGDNLERLLNCVQEKPKISSSIPTRLSKDKKPFNELGSLSLEMEITDAHVHMGDYYKFFIPGNSAEDMLRVMDQLHISQSCVSHHLAITCDWYAGNRLTAQAVARYPNRFIGYVVLSPNEPELAEEELKRAFDDWGFKGIKLVPDNHNQSICSEGYRPVFEFASQRRCLVLVHTYHGSPFDDPQLFGSLAERYPHVPIMMVHSGALPAAFEGVVNLVKKYPNLYLDISGSFITSRWIRYMVAEAGANRVLFSSDQPFIDPRYTLGKLLYAGLSKADLALVLGGNIRRLLNYPVSMT